jgi:Flp pilus assembly pilin Flp
MDRLRREMLLFAAATAIMLAGCGSSSSGVSPAAYVKSICSAIGPFEKDVQSRSSALNLSTLKNASQGKTALHDFLTAVASDTDHAVSQLKTAGTPKVKNGKAISNGIVSAFQQLKTALSNAASQAAALPTSSPEAFKRAAQTLGTNVRSSMSSIGSSLGSLKSPDLEKAAAKDPTCRNLGSA